MGGHAQQQAPEGRAQPEQGHARGRNNESDQRRIAVAGVGHRAAERTGDGREQRQPGQRGDQLLGQGGRIELDPARVLDDIRALIAEINGKETSSWTH